MPPLEPVSSSDASKPVAEIQRSARLLADGKAAEAVRRLEALSAAVPAYATSQVLLAKAYEAEQRWEDALEAWHRAHFLAPGSPLVQRERRLLLEAKERAAEAASPPELPPEPAVDQGAEEVDGEEAGERGEQDEVAANEIVEPDEKQAETMPDEALLNEARHDAAEPSDSEELTEALPEEALPEVFVDDSAPVSDALGTAAAKAKEIWGDDAFDSDAGWTVVSETETERTKKAIMEAQIAAPMDEAEAKVHANAEDVAPAQVAGADATAADDLDSLIRELEDAPRIRPDPDFIVEEEVLEDEIADDMVSETLARIYVAQGQFGEAASVYEKLANQHPERVEEFREKAAELRARVGGGV